MPGKLAAAVADGGRSHARRAGRVRTAPAVLAWKLRIARKPRIRRKENTSGAQCRKVAAAFAVGGRFACRPCGRAGCGGGPRGFSVEIPHYTETFQSRSMFYFRATKSFHVNRRQGADSRAGTGRANPGSTTLPPAFTAPRRQPGTVTLPRAGFAIMPRRAGTAGRLAIAAREKSRFLSGTALRLALLGERWRSLNRLDDHSKKAKNRASMLTRGVTPFLAGPPGADVHRCAPISGRAIDYDGAVLGY
jgi:hypothetical protein